MNVARPYFPIKIFVDIRRPCGSQSRIILCIRPASLGIHTTSRGYQILVVGADSSTVTLDSAKIATSSDYILANRMEGNPLGDYQFPLCLLGPGPTAAITMNGVKEIVLVSP